MRVWVVMTALAMISCGGSAKQMVPADAYGAVGGDELGGDWGDADVEEEITVTGSRIGRSSSFGALATPEPWPEKEQERTDIGKLYQAQKEANSGSDGSGGSSSPGSIQDPPPKPPVAKPEQAPVTKVVYTGHLMLRVKRLMDAVEEITRITKEKDGYVQSLSGTLMIVRIPGDDFDEVMDALSAVGNLLNRRIEAMDVTDQYTDLRARLDIAKITRERLMALLEDVTDIKERIKIVEEITRLSDQIESLEATLASLKNLIKYFTIYIELQPVLDHSRMQRHRSPFSWVRNLAAHRTTIYDGSDDVELDLPKSFVLFDDTDEFRAQASDTTLIRVGRLDNEPSGDNDFWIDAIEFEMEARDEVLEKRGEAGKLKFLLYKNRDLKPRYYLIALRVYDDDLFVVEVFFPTEESFEAHGDDVMKSLETLEVN